MQVLQTVDLFLVQLSEQRPVHHPVHQMDLSNMFIMKNSVKNSHIQFLTKYSNNQLNEIFPKLWDRTD